jgi:hypothetical protein
VEPPGPGTPLREKRSPVTVIPGPDGEIPPAFRRSPLPGILSHKRLIAILIAILIIAGVAAFGGIPVFPSPGPHMNPGNGTALPASVAQPAPDLSPVPGPEPVATETTVAPPVYSPLPGPTQVPPEKYLAYFQVTRDPFSDIVSVLFMGSNDQAGIQDVVVRLTRSDGQVLTGTFRPLETGTGVELQGTEKTDRVEVTVQYYTGDAYTVINQTFEYQKLV